MVLVVLFYIYSNTSSSSKSCVSGIRPSLPRHKSSCGLLGGDFFEYLTISLCHFSPYLISILSNLTCSPEAIFLVCRDGLEVVPRVRNLLFRSLLFRSLQKEQRERIAPVALFKRATRAKWADRSFHFSNTRAIRSLWRSKLLFLRVGFAPFEEKTENWAQNLYHTFWLCFKKKRAIRSSSLFLLF